MKEVWVVRVTTHLLPKAVPKPLHGGSKNDEAIKRNTNSDFRSGYLQWGGGLPREGVGAKEFNVSLQTQGKQTFRRDIPGFAGISRRCPKSLRKKDCVQFSALNKE